jgi:hypothetical protein
MDLKLEPYFYEKTLVFTVTSDGYKYYTWNLYRMLEAIKVPWKLCILCLDRESYDFFKRIAQIPSRLYLTQGNGVPHKTPFMFGTQQFKRMNRLKVKALEDLSQLPQIDTLIYMDSDIAVFQDFLPTVRATLETHPLVFQCDEKREGSMECTDRDHCLNPCSGFIGMSLLNENRQRLKQLFTFQKDTWDSIVGDQDYIYARLKSLNIPYFTLPRDEFPNGVFLSENKFREGKPFLLHFNYVVGNMKQRLMKEKECWVLPEYV